MELVEGPTLADRIAPGAIPLDEALPIAKQIAEALEAAHEQGIIHRDLKPANIKVAPTAPSRCWTSVWPRRSTRRSASSGDAVDVADPSMHGDAAGVILGTAAYMSPEQARGKAVDKRADIWAFGCVLFEMLTGRRAFGGDDVTDTIVAVVSKEPDWTAFPAARRCVRPLFGAVPEEGSEAAAAAIGDARIQIDELIGGSSEMASPRDRSHFRRRRPQRSLAFVGGVAVGVSRPSPAITTWMRDAGLHAVQRPAVSRFGITLPPAQPLAFSFNDRDLALSADGTRLAYTAGAQAQLMVRIFDQLEPRAARRHRQRRVRLLSPDGRWIGYFDRLDEGTNVGP